MGRGGDSMNEMNSYGSSARGAAHICMRTPGLACVRLVGSCTCSAHYMCVHLACQVPRTDRRSEAFVAPENTRDFY